MTVVKNAEERKEEILDAAERLFGVKGYDKTSVLDIMNEVGIAKGTLYYHFRSKEEILDAMTERITRRVTAHAKKIAQDPSGPVCERLFRVLLSLNLRESGKEELLTLIHRPQNALLHQKSRQQLVKEITPVLTELLLEGIREGLFDTEYPKESIEMTLIYVQEVFDDTQEANEEEMQDRVSAFIVNLERIFGAPAGCFAFVRQLV
ncbi:MAG TPA: TetR/AcrR family transcriptional regulator [Lachnospiraceae bacterium]|nr:TetR/AcrR family transcriptional regulator [Lachnospiraceae bacterium]